MATIVTETPATEDVPAARPRRARRSRAADTSTGASPRRGRRERLSGDALVASLAEMVDQLVAENRQLKRELAQAEKNQGGGGLGQAVKTLAGLQRRVSRALESGAAPRRSRSSATQAAPRRRVTDPELLERRRQALEKARAARAAKRAAAQAE